MRADETGEIVGYAAVFNQASEDLGGFVEIIRPGAFRDVLGNDVRALFNHDANYVLGRNSSGTLRLEEDGRGLASRITPPETQWAKDLVVSMRRGDVDQMSFGFKVGEDEWSKDKSGTVTREIRRVERLHDVSVVTYPAYPQTTAEARSMADQLKQAVEDQAVESAEEQEGASRQARHAARRRKIEIQLNK